MIPEKMKKIKDQRSNVQQKGEHSWLAKMGGRLIYWTSLDVNLRGRPLTPHHTTNLHTPQPRHTPLASYTLITGCNRLAIACASSLLPSPPFSSTSEEPEGRSPRCANRAWPRPLLCVWSCFGCCGPLTPTRGRSLSL